MYVIPDRLKPVFGSTKGGINITMHLASTNDTLRRSNYLIKYIKRKKYLYLLLIPCIAYFIIFHYVPMYGVIIAFKDFKFSKGIIKSPWIGLDNFLFMFNSRDFHKVFLNSIILSTLRILFNFPAPIVLAIILNEIRHDKYKRICQTIVYLPHFISWAVIGSMIINFLSPTWGVVNYILKSLNFEPIAFMGKKEYFRTIVVLSNIWKETGWGTILYLAAISNINIELFEASIVDGANRWHRIVYVLLPSIRGTIIALLILNIGRMMTNGFEQIFILQNSMNLDVSEVFETFTYRIGLLSGRFSFATAVGLFTSSIGMILLVISNKLARLFGEEGIY